MDFSKRWIQYVAAFSVSLATLTLGMYTAWPSPVIPKLLGNETSIAFSENQVALMIAMTPPGFVIGGLITRFISDAYGRRNTVLISAVPNIVGTLFIVFGNNIWFLFTTKFLWGLGNGMIGTVVPMYIGEIADKEIRGTLSIFTRVMFHLGSLVIMSIGTYISFEVLNYIMLIVPVFYLLSCLWIPESPYYLLKEGKVDAAKNTLRLLNGISDKELENELEAIQSHVKSDMRRDTSIKELFTGKQYRRALIIAIGLKTFLMTSGTITVSQFIGRIMQESGANMSLATVLIPFGALKFIVSIMSAFLVEKVDRRFFYISTYLGTSASFFVVAIYFFLQEVIKIDTELLQKFGFLPFVGIMSVDAISNIGFGSLTFITLTEIFPLNIKAVAMTTVSILGGFLIFTTTLTFNFVKQYTGLFGSFMMFTIACVCAAIFFYIFLPETRGKSLKEIQEILQGEYMDKDIDEVKVSLKSEDNTKDVEMKIIHNDS